METWVTIFISIPIGAISSLIAWWILNYCIKPKIIFSNDISRIDEHNKPFYRFKFENCGSRRILDSQIIAKLRIKGLKYSTNLEIIYLPLDNEFIPIIKPTKNDLKKIREVPRLELGLIDSKYFRFLEDNIKEKIKNDKITLEELMTLGIESELILYVTGFDEISGAKKTFESKPYKITDIKKGKFNSSGLNVRL